MTKRATIESMARWLAARDDIALLGHVCPDGDAAGSTLGLWHALRAMGKRAAVVLPGGMPKLYAALPGADRVLDVCDPLPFEPAVALAVDVSDHPRLGEGAALFDRCPEKGVLDHHGTNEGFGDIMLLDADAAAAGEIATAVIEAMGLRLSREMAECLFTAISTDCGHFSYANTRPETFRAAAACAGAGIDISAMTEWLYRTRTLARTRLLGAVLNGLGISGDGKLAWAFLTEEMLARCGAIREDNEGIVNYLQEIDGVVFAVLVEQRGDATKLSMRSKVPLDVARSVAIPLGGGGHVCAAGATVPLPMDQALEKALALARRAIAEGA